MTITMASAKELTIVLDTDNDDKCYFSRGFKHEKQGERNAQSSV
jgi:hypothetical protein